MERKTATAADYVARETPETEGTPDAQAPRKTTGRLPIKQGFWRPGAPGGSCRPSPMWKALAHMHRAHRLAWVREHLRRDLTPSEREMVQLMNRSQRRAFVAAQNRRGV